MHTTSITQPEAIIDWLNKEIGYRPLGPHHASSNTSMPSSEGIRRVCRGNMVPVFEFLLTRVKSEKTVDNIRRNIIVHGRKDNAGGGGDRKESRGGKKKGNPNARENNNNNDNKEAALHEREEAEKEVKRLRHIVRRKRKELNEKMVEVSREENERKRVLDERSNYRHKQVMLEAYGTQCDVTASIFTQYHKHLLSYVSQATDSHSADADSSVAAIRENNIRKACETLADQTIEKIHDSFPAYEGYCIHSNPHLEASKLGLNYDENVLDEVQDVILECLKSPHQLLAAVTAYTQRLKSVIVKEIEKIDVRADAEMLRYKYENNKIIEASPDIASPLPFQLYGNGNNGHDMPSNGTRYQRLERQKAHVQQFMATEDQLNKAAGARNACQNLFKRLSANSQNMSSLRQLELEVWAMEREAAGLKASLTTLTCEAQRLNTLRLERKEVEDCLNKKWKKIEAFDARRLELKSICDALIKAITDNAAFWIEKPLSAREQASKTIIPACTRVVSMANITKDLINEEVSAYSCSPDNRLYMLPSTPQALLESVGPTGWAGPEPVAVAEKTADLLTARAGSGDPSAIPSICRVSAALQYPAEGSEAVLASVLEPMEFCLKSRGSEASVMEELSKAMNLIHTNRELVESGRSMLDHANNSQKEYKVATSECLDLASEQEEMIMNEWLPELKKQIANAEKSLDECKYIDGLIDEWWEQPASTLVDWVTMDEQSVVVWQNHVKQLLAAYEKLNSHNVY